MISLLLSSCRRRHRRRRWILPKRATILLLLLFFLSAICFTPISGSFVINHRGPVVEGRVPRTIFDGGAGSSFSSVHRKTLSRIQRTSSSDLGSSSRNEPVGDSERNREKILSGPVALDESLRVYNPLTKRTIRRHGTSDDAAGKKWHAFMYIEGGYIAISTLADKILSEISAPYELVPLNLEMLALWNDNHSRSSSERCGAMVSFSRN